jgi:hypothetical protein
MASVVEVVQAKENADAGLALASESAKAKDIFRMQSNFAQT